MSVKLLSENTEASVTDEDEARIRQILDFWFMEQNLAAPQIDARMDVWFGEDAEFDGQIIEQFSDDVSAAAEGRLDHWAADTLGRLALIILLDQFMPNMKGLDKCLLNLTRSFLYI